MGPKLLLFEVDIVFFADGHLQKFKVGENTFFSLLIVFLEFYSTVLLGVQQSKWPLPK